MKRIDWLYTGIVTTLGSLLLVGCLKNSNYYRKDLRDPVIQWKIDGEIIRKEYVADFRTVSVSQNSSLDRYCEYVSLSTSRENKPTVVIGHRFANMLKHDLPPEVELNDLKILLCPQDKRKE